MERNGQKELEIERERERERPVICLHGVTWVLLQDIPCCHAIVMQDAAGTYHLGDKQRPDLQIPQEDGPPAGFEDPE